MGWNPFIELRCEAAPTGRSECKACKVTIDKGSWRAVAVDVLSREEFLHLDCAAKRTPDLAARKVKDRAPDWPPEALDQLARFVPTGAAPAPRSYQRTPILDLSCEATPQTVRPCAYCGDACPAGAGPLDGVVVRAFSIDGERRLHPACALELAPGLCKRVVAENSERWPAEVKALFARSIPAQVPPTPRSPWRNTGGLPLLERSPSARAACRYCQGKIAKEELRIAREQVFGMRKSPVYFHVGCYVKSDDFHPRLLELLVLKADPAVTRGDVEQLAASLPPPPPEDDDVPPLGERLLALWDAVSRSRPAQADASPKGLTENVVVIPDGFFTS